MGRAEERAAIAAGIAGVDADRIAIAPSVAAIELALFYVLADPGAEVLVWSDPIAVDVAAVSGLDATPLSALDAETLYESASDRTRVLAIGTALDPELVELLGELAVPLVCHDSAIAEHPIFRTEHAPLVALVGERGTSAWLAVLGPADRAEPLVTRLEWHAHVFFARTGA
jgi:hypothetical protein